MIKASQVILPSQINNLLQLLLGKCQRYKLFYN